MQKNWRFGNFFRFLAAFAVFLSAVGLMTFTAETLKSAREGITLCIEVVLPSLFPFFVISTLAVELGLAGYAGIALEKIMRFLFNVNGACAPAFALGLVGGYPVGAKTAIAIYEKKQCTRAEAERLLAFCNNSGPAFILGAVGAGIFNMGAAGILLYVAHVLGSVTTGILFRFYKFKDRGKETKGSFCIQSTRITKAFIGAVTSGFSSVLNICAFVIFFAVAIRMLYLMGVIPFIARLIALPLSGLGLTFADAERLLTGIIEVTSGLWSLSTSGTSLTTGLAMAAFMLGWAGISVHCQVLTFIGDSDLSPLPYIAGKFCSAVFSTVYIVALTRLFPFTATVSASLTESLDAVASLSFASSLSLSFYTSLALWGVFLIPSFLYRILNRKKIRKNP